MPRYTSMDAATTPPAPIEPRPHVPLRAEDLPWQEYAEGERFGARFVPLARHGGGSQIGVNLLELPPGKQSCPAHHHLREEEHLYVLSGRAILRADDARHEVAAGDYAGFPAGTGVAHAFENPFAEPCRLLLIGTRCPDEIAVYPDSGKAKLRALEQIVAWPQENLDYFHGEATDDPVPRT